jgi:hypothetical protein
MLSRRNAKRIVPTVKPEIKLKLPTLKLIELIELKTDALTKKLPDVLSNWIVGIDPKSIYQIQSPQKGFGFNTIAWRDQDGSKLYLENLASVGVIDEKLKVTYPEVQSLKENCGWTNSLPDTIFVKLKFAGGLRSRMANKKMVLGLLDSYQSFVQLPNKPVLKETKTDDLAQGEFVITFSVKGITQLEPIMNQTTFLKASRSTSFTGPLFTGPFFKTLNSYQNKLQEGVVNGFRIAEVASRPDPVGIRLPANLAAARRMVQEIKDAAQDLLSTVNTEIANKEKTTPDSPDLATLKKLQKQVTSAIADGFKNELDTRRWQKWFAEKPVTEKPLTEDNLVPGTGKEIGAGIYGPVFKYDLDPVRKRGPVVVKYDRNRLNQDAKGAGIPELNPQQSVRAKAAFKISQHLGLGVIPQTEFFVGTDENGRPILGQAMDVVNGPVGQRTAGIKNKAASDQKQIQDYANIANNLGKLDYLTLSDDQQYDLKRAQEYLSRYVKVKGQWYSAQNFPVNIDYGDPVVQKGLSDLQVLDYIIGHMDRNAGNWIYEKDTNGRIIGVKGIDNDDTFGKDWLPLNPAAITSIERGSKTPVIPPIVDISTALSILNADFDWDIYPFLAGLSDEEITKAAKRFDMVQGGVLGRVLDGNIASMTGKLTDEDQSKLELVQQKVLSIPAELKLKTWGKLGDPDPHTEQNSYLGLQLAQKTELAKQYQVGVVPESGDVGLVQPQPVQPQPVQPQPDQQQLQLPAQFPSLPVVPNQPAQPVAQQQAQQPAQQQAQQPGQFPPLPVVPNP